MRAAKVVKEKDASRRGCPPVNHSIPVGGRDKKGGAHQKQGLKNMSVGSDALVLVFSIKQMAKEVPCKIDGILEKSNILISCPWYHIKEVLSGVIIKFI